MFSGSFKPGRTVVIAELRRQRIAALVNPQMIGLSMFRIVARPGTLADVAGQTGDRRAVDQYLVRAIGTRPLAMMFLQTEPLHPQFPDLSHCVAPRSKLPHCGLRHLARVVGAVAALPAH